jgi:hypothetical protein
VTGGTALAKQDRGDVFAVELASSPTLLQRASSPKVGSQSMWAVMAFVSEPAATLPGHQAMVQTRMPPSRVLPLLPRSGVLSAPWLTGPPLSLVKMTSVLLSSFSSRSVSSTWPTDQSTSMAPSLFAG